MVCLAVTGAAPSQVRLMASGPGYLRVEFTAPQADRPELAARSCLVGVPLDGQVQLAVVEARAGQRVTAPSADEAGVWLDGPAALGESGFLRRQRVVEVIFAPRREADGTWQLFERVVVDLRLSGTAGEGPPAVGEDPLGEEMLGASLLNFEQAKGWRLGHSRAAAGKPVQDAASTWVRLYLQDEGIYRVTGTELAAAGVDLAGIDPDRLHLRYGGGKPLAAEVPGGPLALGEVALSVEDGGDGRFDAADSLVFYAEPVSRWSWDAATSQYRWLRNNYVTENVYWLEIGGEVRGSGLERGVAPDGVRRPLVATYRARMHQEEEQYVLVQTYQIKSGYDWYWEDFTGNARNLPVVIHDGIAEPVGIRVGFFGLADSQPRFLFKWNDQRVGEAAIPRVRAPLVALTSAAGPREGLNHLGLFAQNLDPVRLDWFELEYTRGLVAEHGELCFDYPAAGPTRFEVRGLSAGMPRLFEVSAGGVELTGAVWDSTAGTLTFQDLAGAVPRRYAVASPGRLKRVSRLVLDTPARLEAMGEGADYLIITHADFREAAERLAAWRAADGRFGQPLRTRVVDVQDLYDEFSGGLLDPAAIRRFVEYALAHWSRPPLYVLLLGDGTYDYKNNSGTSTGNWLPAFQDGDSTYDEWYVSGGDAVPDLAIGRLPVQTGAEAGAQVDRLIAYDRAPEVGLWQSRMLLIADDLNNPEDAWNVETYFLNDAESLARHLVPTRLNLTKLYLGQYLLEGRTKPRARAEFLKRFNQGNLLVTYLGHGNPDVLAHEQLFVVSRDLGEIANGPRRPLFYTAASQVGVFDDPVKASMPEALLKRAEGGVIGMISASRVGYHKSNMLLADAFHQRMYRSGREHVPVGLALMEAKQAVQVSTLGEVDRRNIRRYTLFGDPAMQLAMPPRVVRLTAPDTLHALGEVEVQGEVLAGDGSLDPAYGGEVWVQAFDSAIASRLDGLPYEQLGAPLFRGRYPVQGGRFTARFRVPKDITYQGEDSRISAYAWADGAPAALGVLADRVLAGTAPGVEIDAEGPVIELGFAGLADFASGDQVTAPAVLRAILRDPSGINVTGETGHEIELELDDQAWRVTEEYSIQGGDYREGVLEYPLPSLEPGEHEIRLKAWDAFNNSARVSARFELRQQDPGPLGQVLFYPNPLRGDGGAFTYLLSTPVRAVRVQVFAMSGRLVAELTGSTEAGFGQAAWEPQSRLANGAYLARLEAEDGNGRSWSRTTAVQLVR
jgi:hypothetical protein